MMACRRERESCWCFGTATPQRAPSPPQNGLCSPSTSNGRASPAPLPSVPEKDREVVATTRPLGAWCPCAAVGLRPNEDTLIRAQMASLKKSGKRIKYPHDLQGFVRDQAAQGRRVGLVIDLTSFTVPTSRNYLYVPGLDTFI